MKIFKCPECHSIHEANDDVNISICRNCQVEMEEVKDE